MSHWSVDDALSEVLAAIELGSPSLSLEASGRQRLVDYYRPSFQSMHDDRASWPEARPQILLLAGLVGLMAEVEETLKSFPHRPVIISAESALSAAWVVAQAKFCLLDAKPAGGPHPRGGWCEPPTHLPARLNALANALELPAGGRSRTPSARASMET